MRRCSIIATCTIAAIVGTTTTVAQTPATGPVDPEEVWAGPPPPRPNGTVAVSGFNTYLARHPTIARSPVALVVTFLRLDRSDAKRVSMGIVRHGTAARRGRVTVVQGALPDDSVRAERNRMSIVRRSDGVYRLRWVRQDRRCQPGRGHRNFSRARCI